MAVLRSMPQLGDFVIIAADKAKSGKAGLELLKPAAKDALQKWPVSKRVTARINKGVHFRRRFEIATTFPFGGLIIVSTPSAIVTLTLEALGV